MLRLEPRAQLGWAQALASPLIALALTLAAGVLLFTLLGKDPAQALSLFFIEPLRRLCAL